MEILLLLVPVVFWYGILRGIGYVIGQGMRQGMARPPAEHSSGRLLVLVGVMVVLFLVWAALGAMDTPPAVEMKRMQQQYSGTAARPPGR
jgi:hypothetical protein